MPQNVTIMGASYEDVPAVELPKTGGGIASFTDVTDTTATASDVASGKYFYTAGGVRTQGTGSGGGIDISDTTLTADHAEAGYYFYLANGTKVQGTLANGNNIGYGITDGTLPLVGIAKAGYAELGE